MKLSSRVFFVSSVIRLMARSMSQTSQSEAPGGAVHHLRRTIGINVQLKDRRALGAESSLIVRAARIAFDIDDLAVDRMNQSAAADGAVRANAWSDLGAFDAQFLGARHGRAQGDAGTNQAAQRCAGTRCD